MERQNRYLVVKHEDINAYLDVTEQQQLEELIDLIIQSKKIAESKDPSRYVVVAEDWPMYEDAWRAIERWVDGEGQPTTQSLADQIKAIPWAPWVNWMAMDNNGDWYVYYFEPTRSPRYKRWNGKHREKHPCQIFLPKHPDWTKSKVRVNDE